MKNVLPLFFVFLTSTLIGQVTLYDPITTPSGATTCQDFETAFDIYDSRIADDFVVPAGETWYIDSIALYGSYSATATTESGVVIRIYEDNAGSFGSLVFNDSITSDVDGNGDGTLTPYWSNPISLTAGHYWMVATARKDFSNGGGQWYWGRETTQVGYPAKFKNPGNGFGSGCTSWINLYDCTQLGLADSGMLFRIWGCYGPNKPAEIGDFDTTVCATDAVNLTIGPNPTGSQANVSYTWNTGATTQDITVTSGGFYFVYVEDSVTQCGVQNNFYVNVEDVPIPDIEDQTTCEGTPATFTNNTQCPNCIPVWPDGSNLTFYSSSTEGWVTLTILDTVTGCSRTDSAYLTVIDGDLTFFPGDPVDLCEGTTRNVSIQEPLATYSWQLFDGLNWNVISTGTTADVTEGGMLRVVGSTATGCQVNDTVDVIERPLPDPDIDLVNLGTGNVELKAEQGFQAYEWSTGATTANIIVNVNGLYTVTVTDEYGCEGSSFEDVFTVGLDADPVAAKMQVYPNPSNGELTISWPLEWIGNASLMVLDVEGRIVYKAPSTETNQALDLSDLSAGHYVMRIDSPEGIGHAKLVLTK